MKGLDMTIAKYETTNDIGRTCLTNGKTLFPLKGDMPIEEVLKSCFAADFETTTVPHYEKYKETRVWSTAFMSIIDDDYRVAGTSIEEFMLQIYNLAKTNYPYPALIAFHNARFDFSFIENYMLKTGFNPTENIKLSNKVTSIYSFLRNSMGQLYSVDIKFGAYKSVKIIDFAKIMPASLESIGAALDIPKRKELIDYHKIRPIGYILTPEEIEYQWDDVIILARAWRQVIEEEGCVKLTRSSYAALSVKRAYEKTQEIPDLVKFSNFNRDFPPTKPEEYNLNQFLADEYAKQLTLYKIGKLDKLPKFTDLESAYADEFSMHEAYAGGVVFFNPNHVGKVISKRIVSLDVTSLYPSQWLNHYYPFGSPIKFGGNYDDLGTKLPLYIQRFTAKFTLKIGGFPCLPKKLSKTGKTIYASGDLRTPTIDLCNVDLELFFDNYEVSSIVYEGGVMFNQKLAPFKSFVDEQGAKKTYYGTEEGWNPLKRLMAKLTVNGSYGKFGQSPFLTSKDPHLDDEGVTRFSTSTLDPEEVAYLPIAIFTTAYGRQELISMIKLIGVENVLYDDTDSIKAFCDWESEDPKENFMLRPEIACRLKTPEFIAEHGTDFDSWEDEAHIEHFKMLRDKCYAFHVKHTLKCGKVVDEIELKAAGLTDDAKASILFYFNEEGRILHYSELTGEKVWLYKHEVSEENHRPLHYPVYKPWEEVFENFRFGYEFPGCLMQKQVKGGVLLIDAKKVLMEDTVFTYTTEDGGEADISDLYL